MFYDSIMLKVLLLLLALVFFLKAECVTKPCTSAVNFTYFLKGEPDTRPSNWGLHEDQFLPLNFFPPVRHRVVIKRVQGSFIANPIPEGPLRDQPQRGAVGFLFALSASLPAENILIPGDDETFLLFEAASNGGPVTKMIDFPMNITLGADNAVKAKGAVFTNTTGLTFDVEASLVITYQLERIY
jgi:hypothetical protein